MGEERTARIGQKRPEFHLGVLQSCTQLWLATFLNFEVTHGGGEGGRGEGSEYKIYN
jgi:hypothetical protein